MKISSHKLKNFTIYGFDNEYIFSVMKNTNDFYEIEVLDEWNSYFDNVEIILDVGANIGNHSLYWSQNVNIKKIIAFEPVEKTFKLLEKNIKDNHIKNVEINQLGLGKKDGFGIIDKQDLDNLGATSLSFSEDETDIKIVSGDNFLFNKNYSIDLVKIDVEGFENDVLKGLKQSIDAHKPFIWVEVNLDNLKETLSILESYNYCLVDIIKFNLLFIHETKLKDLKLISREQLIFNLLKNLEASWTYRNNFLGAEKQKNQEKERAEGFKRLSEKHMSQYLYEQKKCEDLIEINKNLNSSVVHEQKRVEGFKRLSEKHMSQYLYEQKKCEILKNQKEHFQGLVEVYKSRKVVKLADKIIKIYSILKLYLKKVFKHQKDDIKSGFIKTKVKECKIKELKDIKVAVILDEFSYNCFKYEFNAIPVEPSNWFEIFEKEKPDLFLCESAWSGIDSNLRPWQGKIYSSVNFKHENRGSLLDIINYCNENDITTIFWNKEDPTHYDDKVHDFVDTALKFDHIFTTAEECVQKYKDDYAHQSVHLLMFGAQPKLFNPIEEQERSEDIIFAGSWYKHHVKRSIEMEEIFDNILDSGYNLKIYDRVYYTHQNDPNRAFPKKYGKYINPPLPFDKVKKIYKESKYALNINTVTNSNTMFARRVFELMLCNTLVLSNYSKGVLNLFGDDVKIIDKNKIDLSDSEEIRINNLYNVLKNHTYSIRFKQLLSAVNFEYLDEDDFISIYYLVKNQSEIKRIIEHYNSISYNYKKLVLLLSDQIPNHLIKNIYQNYSNNEVSVYSLNYLVNQNGVISNNTPYFIFANLNLKPDFIEKGLLHYSYIEPEVGIMLGDKFTFKKSKQIDNTIFYNEYFKRALSVKLQDNYLAFPVYTIKIND